MANRDVELAFYESDGYNESDPRGPIEVLNDLWNRAIDSPPSQQAPLTFDDEPPF